MGTSYSSDRPQLTQEQQDIQHLGQIFPFGDEEILRLYRTYNYLEHHQSATRASFLTDWAIHCAFLKNQQDGTDELSKLQQERTKILQLIESFILPDSFGEQLQVAAFLRPQDVLSTNNTIEKKQQKDTNFTKVSAELDMVTENMAGLEAFFEGAATSCGRRGGRSATINLFKCCSFVSDEPVNILPETQSFAYGGMENKADNEVARASDLIEFGYRVALAAMLLTDHSTNKEGLDPSVYVPDKKIHDHEAIKSLSNSLTQFTKAKREREQGYAYGTTAEASQHDGFALITKDDFLEWSESTAPLLSSALPTLMHAIFFPDRPYPPSRTALNFPRLDSESAFFHGATSPMLFSFSCMSSSLGGKWYRIFTSECDGLSFNRLQNSLLGYGGPTLMIISCPTGGIFGAFTASAWKESKDFYGNSDCFLFQLLPATAVYRPTSNGTNYMYCNSEARSKGYDGLSHGIGFGGDAEQPRLFITESFDGCIARSQDLTFERGALLPRTNDGGMPAKSFDIETLEVWGVGGDQVIADALGARMQSREITAANIRKARKVDKAAFLEDFQSGLIESKAFKHRGEIRGRADACIDDKHKNTYVYEK